MQVRVAKTDDVSNIEALFHRSYSVLMAQAYSSELLAIALPAMIRANPALIASENFFAVEDAGTIIGCGGWSLDAPGSGVTTSGLAHIRHFAVDPEHGRRGVGRAIFSECAKSAVMKGAVNFQALSSLNAEGFYARMGLKKLDLIDIPMGVAVLFPVVLMEGAIPEIP
ncbi:GNAT family N-acetyltransferase [Yoonia sp. 208BN28-4]|uniref:GNAT family N-acetyltransferase n=1 Tax=Yoonia sp. 208BN28-4 TaxID=3126505 RepID=UPI0030A30786